MPGYTPPAGRPTEPPAPTLPGSNLPGGKSPQTIAQSARDGVPISGRPPAPPNDRIVKAAARNGSGTVEVDLRASGPGTAQIFAWAGEAGYIPVFTTSCSPAADPPPDYGLSACSAADGDFPRWSPDMSGRVLGKRNDVAVPAGTQHFSIPVSSRAERVLVSFETAAGEVQALDVPL
jgi:hypothetical protein